MIGMDLLSFLILLVIGIVVAAILHYGFLFYVIPGTSSFLGKVVVGWLGAWRLRGPLPGPRWRLRARALRGNPLRTVRRTPKPHRS